MKALNKMVGQIRSGQLGLFFKAGLVAAVIASNSSFANEPAVDIESAKRLFIEDAIKDYGLTSEQISPLLERAEKNQAVLDAIARPWEAKPWFQYYPIFLTEKRIEKGVAFWSEHEETLAKAEKTFGVPAEMITAIIGVETFYGTYKGKYSVLDALYSLGFYYPPRAKFFRKELMEYIQLINEEGLDPLALKGSYAGAMGWGQFISSSYRHYAVDFDGDGVRDLLNNPVDAIGSVANYFKQHKWRAGESVAYKAKADETHAPLISSSLKYEHDWQELKSAGVEITDSTVPDIPMQAPAKLLEFELEQGKEHWVGLHNFYVITRYNHSPLYAMAVYQLSQAIKEARGQI